MNFISKLILLISQVVLVILISSCNQSIEKDSSSPFKKKSVLDRQSNTITDFFIDKYGLKQSKYEKRDSENRIIETGQYLDDTLIGFSIFYDSSEQKVKGESYLLSDNTYYPSEFFDFKDSTGGEWVIGSFFQTKIKSSSTKKIITYKSQYGLYDSLIVSIYSQNRNGLYKTERIKTIYTELFDLDISFISPETKKIQINIEAYTTINDGKRIIRDSKRTYQIKGGKVDLSPWEI